jgi:hypothetical protein
VLATPPGGDASQASPHAWPRNARTAPRMTRCAPIDWCGGRPHDVRRTRRRIDARLLRLRAPLRMVGAGVCGSLPGVLRVRLPPGRLAVRGRGARLVGCRTPALVAPSPRRSALTGHTTERSWSRAGISARGMGVDSRRCARRRRLPIGVGQRPLDGRPDGSARHCRAAQHLGLGQPGARLPSLPLTRDVQQSAG